ncbi:pre-mrna-splicing factor slu7 [Gossypium australe]|uniref:Pre-mrna-splicing factor slu7 n=1 Tax=Gossypium australe TaxID=47621 RepID=A0A5B6WDA4_9ROSI|nr:pre-mrna-splicing factor slu7 [Gossypium australe]
MSIVDYEREYSRLSKYAKELIPTEEENCKRKRFGNFNPSSASKRSTESREIRKSTARSNMPIKVQDHQPTVPVGSVKGPNRVSEMQNYEHYGKKHWGKYWKLAKGCFRCGSLEHFARECPKHEDDAQRATSAVRG